MIWLILILVIIGMAFNVLGTLALHRFPDPYTRLHGTTKCTTFGSLFLYIGIIIYGAMLFFRGEARFASLPFHTFFVMILILITNPTSAHAIARAAHRTGIKPTKAIVDKLSEEKK